MTKVYDITDLGAPSGPPVLSVWPRALNSHGQVVGSLQFDTGDHWAFLWHATTGMVELEVTLPPVPHGPCLPVDINDKGSVAGMVHRPQSPNGFRWDPTVPRGTTGAAHELALPAGADRCTVYAINNNGSIVGQIEGGPEAGAALWTTPNDVLPLAVGKPDDRLFTIASGVNDSGQIVGTVGYPEKAFLWQPKAAAPNQGTEHDLGAPPGYSESYPQAINAAGRIIASLQTTSGFWHVGRWRPSQPNGTNGTWDILASTPPSLPYSFILRHYYASAINSAGTAVGSSKTVLGNRRAHAYWPSPSDLNDSILPGSGWLLEDAVDINDGGQILGVGNHSGQRRAFLLTPTKWGELDLGFLGYVTSVIIGVRNDAGGWVRPPGGRPEPVPPWFARIWSGLPESGKRMLRGLAIRDRTTLIRDSEAWEALRTIVPEVEVLERESAAPSDRGA